MVLQLIGKPTLTAINKKQVVLAVYDAERETTTISCDVDIVTLGIAVNVLKDEYEKYLAQLDEGTAEKIRNTTRKAVTLDEVYRSKNSKS